MRYFSSIPSCSYEHLRPPDTLIIKPVCKNHKEENSRYKKKEIEFGNHEFKHTNESKMKSKEGEITFLGAATRKQLAFFEIHHQRRTRSIS